jgi:hypothetical protein
VNYHINGAIVPVTPEEVLRLPLPDFYRIVAALDNGEGKAGKIIRDGDGINTAIVYELGTPLPVIGKEPIRELEFLASTYGDIEDVLGADGPAAQTAVLIKSVAKPRRADAGLGRGLAGGDYRRGQGLQGAVHGQRPQTSPETSSRPVR